MLEKNNVKFLGDDFYLEFGEKTEAEEMCFACGTEDTSPIGSDHYKIISTNLDENDEWGRIIFCPRHMSDLAEQILVHIVRASKGREEGTIKLPLLKVALYKLPEKEAA